MSKSILICGAGGQVGHELSIADSQHNLVPLSREQLDMTEPMQIEAAFAAHQPDIVINAAAYTQVDRAEHEHELAFAINRDGVANLAHACKEVEIPLLHLSTDYVFDGSKPSAYVETDATAPLGIYGESKMTGEALLRASLRQHVILRTSWVFSSTGHNFVKTMLGLGNQHDELSIVDDQQGCPTSARSIANVLLLIADRYLSGKNIEWGTYHYCNQPATTWFGFAQEIFAQASGYQDMLIRPITTSEYPTPAARPANSILDCEKIATVFAIRQASWVEELGLVCAKLDK
ncbi:MAG: dTDP-4-dehydrorhamnose reductase [Gammaproteobacteria bacterium]|nr:dTDP-4-dehydrorhamnose reductase [Gammaproteobacteria bacterium]